MLTDGGLWNIRRPEYNTQTTRLLKSNACHKKKIIEFIISVMYSTYGGSTDQ
jgi:hypothetical protein